MAGLWVWLAACTAPAPPPGPPIVPSADTAVEAAEVVVLDVLRPDGAREAVYALVASPDTVGPHPVLVYARGQSLEAAYRCEHGVPGGDVVAHTDKVVRGLAAEGFVTVAPLYRSHGPDVPTTGGLWPRDHGLLDASAVLAAARHGAAQPGADGRVLLLGASMGSFPVLWAASAHTELAAAQQGLDLRGAVTVGMLGDHLGNVGRTAWQLDEGEELARAEAITAAVAGAAQALSFDRGQDPLRGSAFAADVLTDAGQGLLEAGFLGGADPAVAGCEGLVGAPICAIDCITPTFYDALGAEPFAPEAFLTPQALGALHHWADTEGADPGPEPADPLLAALRARSPAYGLPGAVVARFTVVTSAGDHVVQQQLAYGDAPVQRLVDALAATGADAAHVAVDAPDCGHEDYLLPHRPECGFLAVRSALDASLESP